MTKLNIVERYEDGITPTRCEKITVVSSTYSRCQTLTVHRYSIRDQDSSFFYVYHSCEEHMPEQLQVFEEDLPLRTSDDEDDTSQSVLP